MTDEERKAIDARNEVLREVARICDQAAAESSQAYTQLDASEIVGRGVALGAAEQASKLARRFRLMMKCYT